MSSDFKKGEDGLIEEIRSDLSELVEMLEVAESRYDTGSEWRALNRALLSLSGAYTFKDLERFGLARFGNFEWGGKCVSQTEKDANERMKHLLKSRSELLEAKEDLAEKMEFLYDEDDIMSRFLSEELKLLLKDRCDAEQFHMQVNAVEPRSIFSFEPSEYYQLSEMDISDSLKFLEKHPPADDGTIKRSKRKFFIQASATDGGERYNAQSNLTLLHQIKFWPRPDKDACRFNDYQTLKVGFACSHFLTESFGIKNPVVAEGFLYIPDNLEIFLDELNTSFSPDGAHHQNSEVEHFKVKGLNPDPKEDMCQPAKGLEDIKKRVRHYSWNASWYYNEWISVLF